MCKRFVLVGTIPMEGERIIGQADDRNELFDIGEEHTKDFGTECYMYERISICKPVTGTQWEGVRKPVGV